MTPNVDLHIEELVLHGFSPADRYRIGKAVESELARLFDQQGVPLSLAWGSGVGRFDGGAFELAHGSKSETVGVQVAQTIYRGLNR